MQIEIRLIEKSLQLTKFQIFQRTLLDFNGTAMKKKFRTKDVAFGQLNEQFIREYQDFALGELGYSLNTVRHYLAIPK